MLKILYVSGLPLFTVFFLILRRFFKLPTRKVVSTKLLDNIYEDMQATITQELIQAETLHFQINGWSNIRNESIINFIINKPELPFIHVLNTKDEKHTAE